MDICLDIDTYKLYTVIYRIPTIYIYIFGFNLYIPPMVTNQLPSGNQTWLSGKSPN